MSSLRARRACASILALCASAANARHSAASVVSEVEPNGTKLEANPVFCLGPGVQIQGVTTGSGTLAGDVALDSADSFHVEICPLPPGIWQHRLVVTTSGADEHTISLRGLNVNGPPSSPSIALGTDVALQVSVGGNGQPNYVQWYGFGQREELFVRVTGTANTVLPYAIELVSVPISVGQLPGALRSGTIEITTAGQGHSTDTEIFVLDGNFVAIPGFRNDDEPGGATNQSRLTRSFSPGVYYLAVGRFNIADSGLSGVDDAYQLAPVLDFDDCILSWSPSGGSNVSFAVTDSQGTIPIAAQLAPEPFDLSWTRITVTDPPPAVIPVCLGDGTGTACPCGNTGMPGHGCGNSITAAGALLVATGLASVSSDSFLLTGSGMPVSSALYFQGTSAFAGGNGQVFGDGLRCAGGVVLRLKTKTNFGGGSQYPGAGDPPISVRGLIPSLGGSRVYQVWYRNSDPTYCTPAFYNLSNGLAATWLP
ncbi:MAG: hypothetical protein NTY35_14015 [Planctomycetota bacterium]|nr:hypothetical protein [Planctomycetota bacterium]